MAESPIVVNIGWDRDAGVWVATSDDIRGLAVEAEDFDKLNAKVMAALHDLVELNGFPHEGNAIPVHFLKEDRLDLAECA